jgi:hypothetical protein
MTVPAAVRDAPAADLAGRRVGGAEIEKVGVAARGLLVLEVAVGHGHLQALLRRRRRAGLAVRYLLDCTGEAALDGATRGAPVAVGVVAVVAIFAEILVAVAAHRIAGPVMAGRIEATGRATAAAGLPTRARARAAGAGTAARAAASTARRAARAGARAASAGGRTT